ncbi:metal-sensing transcriptional repressor [Methanosphaera cuniculi]|uniref:Copper-sensing transcriptional repressor CsoR n=1 Tax=Methanosphaera cuniculi TaxID=1077256 RepID=A0A2A2HBW1_9EURY|nr:metal-sensing transcriptional repressor [Methanosphaera cuniculi]PAV06899.1 metal-sensitive transcriptional repressor [Methanosphaera cuniculi]PWL08662.1 copper-sensing transcriptional repressor CsoR [Methanosphaera cuniculi]
MKQCMDSDNLHRRLRKIEGQVAAIDRMIEEDIPCEDILMQVNAAKSALTKVSSIILEGHMNHCVKDAIDKGDSSEAIKDLSKIIDYYSRI